MEEDERSRVARGTEREDGVAGGGDGRGLSLAKPALRVAWSRYVKLTGR